MTDFSLLAIIDEVLEADDASEDLDVIAKEVLRQIPENCLYRAVEIMLPSAIHDRLSGKKLSAKGDSGRPSSKVTGIRDSWAKYLEQVRYAVADGSMRKFGDLTREDVIFIAGDLDRRSKEIRVRATAMKAIAAEMSERNAEHVRDLPVEYLRSMFARNP